MPPKVEPTGENEFSMLKPAAQPPKASTKPPCFSFRFEKGKNVTLPYRALHISHNETMLVIQEPDPNLGHLTP